MNDKELWELMSIICEGQDSEQRREVEQYITDLQKENERLNNIIDKAIEYIDWQRRNPQYDNVWRNSKCEDLIEILKKENKND